MASLHDGPTVSELVIGTIHRYPFRVAFQCGDESLTYREMGNRLSRWTEIFRSNGLGPECGVGILSKNRSEVFIAQTAALLAGSRYTPLHPLGSFDDHLFACNDATLKVLCVDPSFAARGQELLERGESVQRLYTFGPADVGRDIHICAGEFEGANLNPGPHRPDDIAAIMYTGGTTGVPKGVMLSNRAVTANAVNVSAFCGLSDEVRYLVCAPLSHGANMFVLPTLLAGGTLIAQGAFDAEEWMRTVESQKVTLSFLVPSMIYAILDHPRRLEYDLSSLQTLIYGGSPMIATRVAESLEAFGPVLTQIYGQTESFIATVLGRLEHDPSRPKQLQSCGFDVPGVRIAILDNEDREVAQGLPGEFCIQGPTVMTGYLNQPALTSEALRSGWLHTGDIGVRDADGLLYIVDRKKDMIISGGFNVYPREVEDVLSGHTGVASSAVIGVPDGKWGEAVTAYVVPRPGVTLDVNELRQLVRAKKGAAYTPKHIYFVDSLPLTAVGKADKKALRLRSVADSVADVDGHSLV
jgi:fatty-acyl-CoA synthase